MYHLTIIRLSFKNKKKWSQGIAIHKLRNLNCGLYIVHEGLFSFKVLVHI